MSNRLKCLWGRRPWLTRVHYFEHTRIEWRPFWPRLRYEQVATVQEQIDAAVTAGGGRVELGRGIFHLYDPVTFRSGTTTVGFGLTETVLRREDVALFSGGQSW